MATISLYKSKINNMPGLIKDVKKSVTDFKSELANLKNKSLQVNKSICNLDDVISNISTSTQTQEQKVATLESFQKNCERFITDAARIDSNVADIVNQNKDDFYNKYNYLKPECEKSGWEKFCDGVKAVGEWCKENWESIAKIVFTVVIIAALGIASVLTGGVLATILAGAFWGALIGGALGGVMGGITSVISGGSFLEGFANGALTGAITGAITGAACTGIGLVGQAFGTGIKCIDTIGKIVKVTSQVTRVISFGMDGFDIVAMGLGLFDPNNPLVKLNQKLHSSVLYNGLQIGVNALAIFTGAAASTMKCFVAGTMILTATGLVAIENIEAGDKVISTNTETFEVAEKAVLETYVRETFELVDLTINGELIKTTHDHPFFVKDVGFVNAGELYLGDKLLDSNGNTLIVEDSKGEILNEPVKVYNFQVEDFHTYHVGKNDVLVHNATDAYKALRKVTPSQKSRDAVNRDNIRKDGKLIDPVYGYEVERYEADHIMPLKEITEQPGFDQLSFEDQRAVVDIPENIMGLGKATNASKGAKPISEWSGHSRLGPIPKEIKKLLLQKDKAARQAVTDAIEERLKNGNI